MADSLENILKAYQFHARAEGLDRAIKEDGTNPGNKGAFKSFMKDYRGMADDDAETKAENLRGMPRDMRDYIGICHSEIVSNSSL